jgi:xanthine dehydrogenase accessory factor
MDNTDLMVLRSALQWMRHGHRVAMATVVSTWGSAPRPVGSWLAIRDDGWIEGSVSGGCIEDDLIGRIHDRPPDQVKPEILAWGVDAADAARRGLPCGGSIRVLVEPNPEQAALTSLMQRCSAGKLSLRVVDVATGNCRILDASPDDVFRFDGNLLQSIHGPAWRLIVIGAGQLSRFVSQIALAADYEVVVVDPREEFAGGFAVPGVTLRTDMPDDAILELGINRRTAVVALTHDPKLDDLALLEALRSDAFYVGALGSRRNQAQRRQRLALFDLSPGQIARLHGPVGLAIGARSPAEIAISILAGITAERHGHQPPASAAARGPLAD